jgi:hypothetical protein
MLLNELLTSTYDWTEKIRKGEFGDGEQGIINYSAQFDAGDRSIVVDIDRIPRSGSHWEMAFGEKRPGKPSSLEVTGSGDEFKVFATVIKITKEFMEKYDIDTLSFTADKSEGNRAKLYHRMVERLVHGKWKKSVDHKASDYRSYFTIEKA